MIGLVPIEFAENTTDSLKLTTLIEFEVDTVCTCENGVMQFGTVTIDTCFDNADLFDVHYEYEDDPDYEYD